MTHITNLSGPRIVSAQQSQSLRLASLRFSWSFLCCYKRGVIAPSTISSLNCDQTGKTGGQRKGEGAFLIEENLSQKFPSGVPFLSHCSEIGDMVTLSCSAGCPGKYLTKGSGAVTAVYTVMVHPPTGHIATKPNQGVKRECLPGG